MAELNDITDDIKEFTKEQARGVYTRFGSSSAIFLILFGFALIIFSILTYSDILFFLIGTLPGIIFIYTGFMIFIRYIRALKYYNLYMAGYSDLQSISDVLYYSKRYIKKDISYMSEVGIMLKCTFDNDGNIFFGEDKKTDNIIEVEEVVEINENDNKPFQEWYSHLKVIRDAEIEFKSEDLSYSLYKMGNVLEQILDYLKSHPEKSSDVKKLMDFHLPSTLKLIDAYRELKNSGINSFSVNKTKEDILSACDKIIEAFQGVLKDLYEDTAIDVSTDITVLKMMLAREGFLDRDVFKIKK